jgi:hypothetical protein
MEEEMSETRAEVVRLFGLGGGRPALPTFSRALSAYADDVENDAWKRALDNVAGVLELVPLDLAQPLPEVKTDLYKQLIRLRDQVTRLEQRSERLGKLEAAGVDNWEGYGFALRNDEEDDES